MEDKETFKMKDRKLALYMEVLRLYFDCGDSSVQMYFDPDSEKNLEKKYRVLKKLNKGEDVPDDDILAILEKVPRDENGNPMVADW